MKDADFFRKALGLRSKQHERVFQVQAMARGSRKQVRDSPVLECLEVLF
jgi:hypothetical protein